MLRVSRSGGILMEDYTQHEVNEIFEYMSLSNDWGTSFLLDGVLA